MCVHDDDTLHDGLMTHVIRFAEHSERSICFDCLIVSLLACLPACLLFLQWLCSVSHHFLSSIFLRFVTFSFFRWHVHSFHLSHLHIFFGLLVPHSGKMCCINAQCKISYFFLCIVYLALVLFSIFLPFLLHVYFLPWTLHSFLFYARIFVCDRLKVGNR